jgi:glycerol-3-phosphate responsive antiterminator
VDAFCAGAGLYHVLKHHERHVHFIYPGKIPDGCEPLIKKEEIVADVIKKELVVLFRLFGVTDRKSLVKIWKQLEVESKS